MSRRLRPVHQSQGKPARTGHSPVARRRDRGLFGEQLDGALNDEIAELVPRLHELDFEFLPDTGLTIDHASIEPLNQEQQLIYFLPDLRERQRVHAVSHPHIVRPTANGNNTRMRLVLVSRLSFYPPRGCQLFTRAARSLDPQGDVRTHPERAAERQDCRDREGRGERAGRGCQHQEVD